MSTPSESATRAMPALMRHARSLWLVETRAAEDPWDAGVVEQVRSLHAEYAERLAGNPDPSVHLEMFMRAVARGLGAESAFSVVHENGVETRLLEQSLAAGPLRRWRGERRGAQEHQEWRLSPEWAICLLADALHAGLWAGKLLVDMARPLPWLPDVRDLQNAVSMRPAIEPLFPVETVFAVVDRHFAQHVDPVPVALLTDARWTYGRPDTAAPFELPPAVAAALRTWAGLRTIDESLRRGIACGLADGMPSVRAAGYLWCEWPEVIWGHPFPGVNDRQLETRWLPRFPGLRGPGLLMAIADEAAMRGFGVGQELVRKQQSGPRGLWGRLYRRVLGADEPRRPRDPIP